MFGARPTNGGVEAGPRISISVRVLALGIVCATAAVALLCIIATICRAALGIQHGPLNVIGLLDLYQESTLPAWYTSALMLACAPLLAANAIVRLRRREPFARHWLGLAILFVLLSLDETAAVHERVSWPMRRLVTARGIYFYAWVIPASIGLFALGLIYLRFVLNLPRRTRSLLILSAAIYVGAALGLEMVEGLHHARHGNETATYITLVAIEEIMEMSGIALFLYALVDHARQQWGGRGITITFGATPQRAPVQAHIATGETGESHAAEPGRPAPAQPGHSPRRVA
jgi:hypothetical protein